MATDTNYAAALKEYLDRATPDREWRAVLQRSADLVLASLQPAERARLLEYLGRFSPCSAAFIVKELAEVHALRLYSGKEEPADDDIARVRGSYTIPPAGEEEGKRPSDAPNEVIAAALRRERGDDPVHSARVQQLRGDHEIVRRRSATGRSAVCGMAGVRRGVHDPGLDVAER